MTGLDSAAVVVIVVVVLGRMELGFKPHDKVLANDALGNMSGTEENDHAVDTTRTSTTNNIFLWFGCMIFIVLK